MKQLKHPYLRKATYAFALIFSVSMGLGAALASARTLNYATPAAPNADRPTNQAILWWADEVAKRTNGSVEIKVHWAQSLLKYKDSARGIQSGIADMGPISPEYTLAMNPLMAVSQTDLGPGDNYIAVQAWLRAVNGFEAFDKESARIGIRPIGYYSSGVRVNMSTTRPYITPDDFKGDKVRLTPRSINAAQANDWKVTPVNITFADFYSAMERGTIDGAQGYLYLMPPYKQNEVAKYVVVPNSGQSMVVVVMNNRAWDSLSDTEKQVFEELAPIFSEKMAQAGLQEAENAIDTLKNNPDYPVEYYSLTDEQRKVWEEQMRPAVDEYIADLTKRNSAATELHERFLSELYKVEEEVREQGYPWQSN
ncbi:TRAP transporter substrate-binding protein [Marinobacter sp. ANT_B65]|uniref:TRAP transporter substrate-binding protein n=1 Tax=Marinobacter sp. ANT_B65 TaxID=2039467 RepID=UPI000BBE5A99|nr:TRAP transporter substrate-binding protein DctP [Marinobacter sp. ANT_B65]PCM43258.1 C4-dicarboxylate ABC transporter substrate-binding protein [Marinobacter sp. ANT_B65]